MLKISVMLFALLGSSVASAHGLHDVSFMDGFKHPLLGLDHLLAMLAMGVSVAAFRTKGRWFAAGLMALSLLEGLVSARAMQIPLPIDPLLAATLLSLGLVLLRTHGFSAPLRVSLMALFTYLHGFAHGSELPSLDALVSFSGGVVSASLLLFTLGIALGRQFVLRHPCAQKSLGGVLGIAGLVFFGA